MIVLANSNGSATEKSESAGPHIIGLERQEGDIATQPEVVGQAQSGLGKGLGSSWLPDALGRAPALSLPLGHYILLPVAFDLMGGTFSSGD